MIDYSDYLKKRSRPVAAIITLPAKCVRYAQILGFKRFLDNVERGLKGDKESRDAVLIEDLEDIRELYVPIHLALQSADWEELPETQTPNTPTT